MSEEAVRVNVIVTGRVQGVCFRYFTHQSTEGLAVTGFVRNRIDGTVEIEAQGEKDEVDRLLECVREGPSGSRVKSVRVESIGLQSGESSFEVYPTL